MENGEKWICLSGVKFVRSRRVILDDVSWEIRQGEHWTVLGANGSGKTTLLQLIAGYLWPTAGQITVMGKRFGEVDLRELRKEIGWIGSFLQASVPPSQRSLDFIVSGKYATLGIFQKPDEGDYVQAREIAARVRCEHILDQPYAVLSQGEKQRLLIARGLIHKPRLIILDEPCAGLDLVSREELLFTLENLGRSLDGPTMIVVTHHLEEITPSFTHALLLKSGRVAGAGARDIVLTADLLSNVFGVAIKAENKDGRYWSKVEYGAWPTEASSG